MVDPPQEPRLPPELQCYIFTLAAIDYLRDPQSLRSVVKLLLVARRTLAWVRPVLYHALTFNNDPTNKIPPKSSQGTSETKHIAVKTYSIQKVIQCLSTFPNVESLAVDGTSRHMFLSGLRPPLLYDFHDILWDATRFLSLSRLSIPTKLFNLMVCSKHKPAPCLARLTHLQIIERRYEGNFEFIPRLPKVCPELTHLSIDFTCDNLRELLAIIQGTTMPKLQTLCLRIDADERGHYCSVYSPGLESRFQLIEDKRLVLMVAELFNHSSKILDTSWYDHTPGYWDQADELRSRRISNRDKINIVKKERDQEYE